MSLSAPAESDDERTLQASDEDVLREEDDRERLMANPRSGVRRLFGHEHDPNAPRIVDLSRKDVRKHRRRERRARRRRRKGEDETALMFEMENGEKEDDESSSTSSTELFLERPDPQRARRRKLLRLTAIPIALVSLLCLLILGAYKMSASSSKHLQTMKKVMSNGTSIFAPTTLLISIDGFRTDYKDRGLTPALNGFISKGVAPKYMLPSFPSVTFPNHMTLVTGLHPESHGVVGNTFWDPDLKAEYHNTNPAIMQQPKWWPSKTLWSTCEDQGVSTAVLMWPGGEAVQPKPTIHDRYNGTETLARKVDRVLGLLDLPSHYDSGVVLAQSEARPELIALYVPNVDQDGHLYGPNSTEIRTTISNIDLMLKDLFDGLEKRNLTDIVNVIVLSDHGMATTSNDRLIQLEDLLDINDIEHIDGWPLYGLRPFPGVDIHNLHDKLLSAASKHQHFEVYLRENMPKRWHFSKLDRIAPIWIIPEAGWAVVHKRDFDAEAAKKDGTIYHPRGLHGYDNEHPLMRTIFAARGPAFPHEPNSQVEVFQNIEVYNIVCDTLGVVPMPNNGTLRLPFKTIGLHSDHPVEEIPADLPSSTAGTSMTPTVSSSPTPTVSDTPRPSSSGEGDEGKQKHHYGGGVWDYIIGKLNQAKEWWANFHGFKPKGGDGRQ